MVLVLAGMLVVTWLLFWSGSDDAEWPRVVDPAAARRAATILCQDAGGWRELQPAEWPEALVALRPASISVSHERLYVALVPVSGGKTQFHGYYVWPDTAVRPGSGVEREESDSK